MNIHEYQAKELFLKFGVPTTQGQVASSADEAFKVAKGLGASELVVKSQVHAGGRGKGTFKNGFKGGVHVVDSPEKARDVASQMLGQVLVTHQTGPDGKLVSKVLIAESATIAHEYYLAFLVDRQHECPVIVASPDGGMDIEAVAEKTPDRIFRELVHPVLGLQPYQCRKLAKQLGLGADKMNEFGKVLTSLFRLFKEADCAMVEINPLVETKEGKILALDAKFGFDDNALYRQKDVVAMRDPSEEDPREVEASKAGLNYIGLDGSIACMVNGAGLAMATMDIIKHYGGEPANFLDVGGGASKEQVVAAFRIILGDKNVKAILVNIFGGIMDCNTIATGIVEAVKEVNLTDPLVVRLEGNNVAAGKKTLADSGLPIIRADDLADAAQKVVAASKGK